MKGSIYIYIYVYLYIYIYIYIYMYLTCFAGHCEAFQLDVVARRSLPATVLYNLSDAQHVSAQNQQNSTLKSQVPWARPELAGSCTLYIRSAHV